VFSRADIDLAREIGKYYDDALGYVIFAFPWDSNPALQLVELEEPYKSRFKCKYGPDVWACEFLDNISKQVKAHGFDGVNAVDAIREAVSSGHGIGKSAMTGWLVSWIMSTRPYAQGTVTANTGAQLETKTWAQIQKWVKLSITAHWFEINTTKLYHKEAPESWFCSAQTCREENSESFAGQHAANSTSFYIFDEASAVPDVIWEVAEGGLTDGEPMVFAFGNPTRNSGKFHSCFNGQRNRWNTRQVDSRTVKLTNKKLIAEWVEDYGENSDFVKVRVRGMFPSLSLKQFISTNDVDNAFDKHLRKDQYDFAPRIITCDPAWEGDDELVIAMRQGLKFEILKTMPKNDNDIYVANIIAQLEDQYQADAVFIDGGYGTGIISAGRTMGRDWQIVWFSGASSDAGCLNKRAEMWKLTRDWLKEGGTLPKDQQLYRELIGPETVPRLDGKIQIESKKDMKKRGQPSPNKADALCLSFAMPVVKKPRSAIEKFAHGAVNNNNREYDPLANY